MTNDRLAFCCANGVQLILLEVWLFVAVNLSASFLFEQLWTKRRDASHDSVLY